jgi:hypothetical protein
VARETVEPAPPDVIGGEELSRARTAARGIFHRRSIHCRSIHRIASVESMKVKCSMRIAFGRKDRVTRPGRHRAGASRRRRGLLVAVALLNLAALGVALGGPAPTAQADPLGKLDILVPKPANNAAEGPVGANVSIKGTGAANHTYQLGYATQGDQCASGMQQISDLTVKAKGDGTFSTTFLWPAGASSVGTSYYVCAQDSSLPVAQPVNPPIQSSEVFKVDAAAPPSIRIQTPPPASSATPVPTPTDGGYYANSTVLISGSNFVPGGAQLEAFVTVTQDITPADVQGAHLLQATQTIKADGNGDFEVLVTLPSQPQGDVFLHVVSSDGTQNLLPALVATQPIHISRALPTPTPSPSPTIQPSPSGTAGSGTGTGTRRPPDPSGVLAVVGLSGLSIILFIVGIILMTSASAMPRNAQR